MTDPSEEDVAAFDGFLAASAPQVAAADAGAPWLRAAVAAQLDHRIPIHQ